MSRDELFNLLAVVLLVLPFIDWAAVVILLRALVRRRDLPLLKDRFFLALGIAGVTSLFALLAMARLGHFALPNDVIGILLTILVILLSLVQLVFVVRYWRYAWGGE